MSLTPDELTELQHRPLFNLLSQTIASVGQPLPHYYMQRPDGTMVDMLDGGNGCAAYVTRMLAAMGIVAGKRLIDGPHGTVKATVDALVQAGWQQIAATEAPQPGDVIVWEAQQQVDGVHTHIGFSLGNNEAASTDFVGLKIHRHDDTYGQQRRIAELLRYPWNELEYDALAHLDPTNGRSV